MNIIDIVKILGEMGGRFPKSQLGSLMEYFTKMIADGRVIVIWKDKEPYAVMAFSIGNDFEKFHKKTTWDYIAHDQEGSTLYIELLVCKQWTKELRKQFEQEILKHYPQLEEAHWDRWVSSGERHVKIRRSVYV